MNWYREYEADLTWVFAEAESIISKFPKPLNTVGLTYLNGFHVLREGSTNNYICYLLPFWLMDIVPIDREVCRKLSLANVLGMLYFFIQDDHMDSRSQDHKDDLPLAALLHMKFLAYYQELFPASSPFWVYYSEYITDWADAVTNEQQARYFLNNPLLIARKSSPLKLCSTGVCLLMEQDELVPILSLAIDHILATLQMADDWADWQYDLLEGNYNSLIDYISSQNPTYSYTDITHIKKALYVSDQFTSYVQIAIDHHSYLRSLSIRIPQLINFHEFIINRLIEEATRITKEREKLTSGGLTYWLSNIQE